MEKKLRRKRKDADAAPTYQKVKAALLPLKR